MGKADMSRDYYADLELSSTADISDIKKQFRKLALKYHPDRNPGREAEVNSKFQLIQSAHEILADPEQKAKYDASRSRARYPTASGVKGNPWANAATNFPPPPRRNASTRNPPPSGANKYRNFTSGVPPTAKAPQRDDGAEARRNAWRAFESMRPSSHGKAGQSNSSEKPEPTQTTTGTRPVPRTPSQKQRAEAAFGTRKSGFVPRSPVPGDEPPVTTRNYATGRHTASLFNDTASGARRGSIDPLGQAPLDSRQSTPYSTHGGEKTNPFDGVPLGRARSTREGSRPGTAASSANLSPGTSRQRSSSAPRSAKDDGANPRPTVFDSERPNTANPASHPPLDPVKTRASAKYTPDSAMPAASAGLTDQGASTAAAAAYGNSGANSTASTKSNGPSIFNFAFSADEGIFTRTSPKLNTFTRNSADDINTRFVHDEAPTWQFNAGSPQEDSPAKPRSQSGSRAGRKSPVKRPSLRHTKNIPSKQAEPVLSTSEDGFDAQGWSQKIDAQHFVPQPNPSGAGSPGRPARSNSRKPKSVRPTMGSAGMVNEDTSSSSEEGDSRGRQPYAEAASTNSPNAMDIDPPSPLPTASGPGSGANGARKIPVEPSRPDWRAGNVKGVKGGAPISSMQGPPRFSANAQGSEDSEEFLASFGDLKNVAPFAKTVDGLGSFGDMKSNLPFESQPSAKIPIEKVVKPTFRFPPVPQAPRAPPPLAISGLKPSGGTWQRYVLDFQGYVQRWDIFNAQIVEYLELRKAAIAKSRQDKGYSFLAARGDDDIQDYMTSLQQDNEVRRKWTEACADHEQRIREFMAFRERMR